MRISVCLASKNGELFIKEQIDSILMQLSKNDELVISDDSSDDNTVSILNSYISDSRVRIYHSDFNNHVRNFEFVLKKAKGNYIFLSDQDDVWLPDKVEVMLSYLQKNDMVVSNSLVVDRDLNPLFNFFLRSASSMNEDSTILKVLRSPTSGCCMAFTRNLLEKALPFPTNMYMHDRWLWAIACTLGSSPLIIDDVLILYRRHRANFTNDKGHDPVLLRRSHASMFKKIELRYILMSNLLYKLIVFRSFILINNILQYFGKKVVKLQE
jgi:glycosyltransferase involved in cell wall biosynthesis